MRLAKISIKDFRSIKNIHELDISSPVSAFVGANEHGKSNILRALHAFSSGGLSSDDCRKDGESKVYAPSIWYSVVFDELDREAIGKILKETYPENTESIPSEIIYRKHLEATEATPDQYSSFYTISYEGETDPVNKAIYSYITKTAPKKIIFFDEFTNRLGSKITEAEINDPDNLIVAGLLRIAGLADVKDKIFDNSTRIRHLAEVASQKATEDVRLAWRQGSDDEISITIGRDTATRTLSVDVHDANSYVELDSRSRGFQWFLSFYLGYRAHHDGEVENSNSIFVMDEPGLFLHPKGQKDLLLYLEKLGKNNQVMYSTHSPFMLNRLEPHSIKVVVRKKREGTVVNAKGYSANWRPLRTSLGMVLSDSFYFADKTLVVEGVEDQLYITALIKYLYNHKVIPNVDVTLLSIIAAGGATEVPAMTRIVIDEERPTAVLIDSDRPKEYTRLEKFPELKGGRLRQVRDFGDEKTVTIQDLLPRILYQEAVNAHFDQLVVDGTLNADPKGTRFKLKSRTTTGMADKQVDEFAQRVYGVERISKVGIARCFEELLATASYKQSDFENSEALVKWVVNTLNLSTNL